MSGPAVSVLHGDGADHVPDPAPLLAACVAARARRRLAWLDTLHGNDDADTVDGERQWQASSEAGRRHGQIVAAAHDALSCAAGNGFDALCAAFALAPVERDLLMSVIAQHLDVRLLPLCQRLQGRPWVTEVLVARLFGHAPGPLWNCNGALAAWDLVRTAEAAPAEPPPLVADPALPFWLRGDGHLDRELSACVWPLQPPCALASWPVADTAARIRAHWQRRHPVRVLVEGPTGSGRASFAACLADALGRQALLVHDRPGDLAWPRLWLLMQRQAVVCGAVTVWRAPHAEWPRNVAPSPLQVLCVEAGAEAPPELRAAELRVTLPEPRRDECEALLAHFVPESRAWAAAERTRLLARPGVVVGDLAHLQRQGTTSLVAAEAELRAACAGRLGEQAERLETPFDWHDLVLPAPLTEALRDFAYEAGQRRAYWERPAVRRLFPGGRALVALFAGPPGTGKTMAAQIIARELGVDLLRIDLATMMSKYIGETAKNLKQVFTRAAQMHAVLLFDEADALFANRTEVRDAHDRYANTDTNYLLQQLESFSGIALLASNKKTNMDSAFLRRIRYVFDFPRPDAAARRELWRRLSPALLGVDPPAAGTRLAGALDRIGTDLDLSGAQIKNALVAAHFAARRRGAPADVCDLLRGVQRELVKEGRALTARDQHKVARAVEQWYAVTGAQEGPDG